jgi:hypothetical protein
MSGDIGSPETITRIGITGQDTYGGLVPGVQSDTGELDGPAQGFLSDTVFHIRIIIAIAVPNYYFPEENDYVKKINML